MSKKQNRNNRLNNNQRFERDGLMSQNNDPNVEPWKEELMNRISSAKQESEQFPSPDLPNMVSFSAKLRAITETLTKGLVERDLAIRLGLLAALSGEHMLMLGPPGTAKSLVARRLHLAFQESKYFERLLTRFTVPEELFGPLSIKGLENDKYERLTTAYLPTASIAFLDEIFKANSAILNALLTLLNEREFDNGTVREKTPLVAVIGASNELPQDEELNALFDRFLLRLYVGPVSKQAFRALLDLRGQLECIVEAEHQLKADELLALQEVAQTIEIPQDVIALLCNLRDWCTAEGLTVSDRRWRKIVKLLQVSAATNARSKVSIWDCWLLQHCLWDTPETREKIFDWYSTRVGSSAAMDPARLTRITVSWEGQLQTDKNTVSQMKDKDGNLLFIASDGKYTREARQQIQRTRGAEPLYFAPKNSKYHHYNNQNHEQYRTNNGNGYTEKELNQIIVIESGIHNYHFYNWPKRNEYLESPENQMMDENKARPALEPTRHKKAYINECIREIDDLIVDIETYQTNLAAHIESLRTEIRNHLWVSPDFAEPAAKNLETTQQEVDNLHDRVLTLRRGFETLPQEEHPHHPSVGQKAKHQRIK